MAEATAERWPPTGGGGAARLPSIVAGADEAAVGAGSGDGGSGGPDPVEGGHEGGNGVGGSERPLTARSDASVETADSISSSVYTNLLDWRRWRPGPWNKFARYESRVDRIKDKYEEKGYRQVHVADLQKPKDTDQFVDVEPRPDARGSQLVSEQFRASHTMRVHLPLGDFHEGDECEFFSLVDSRWFSDGVVTAEHPYTGALTVEFDRSGPGQQHSPASRVAVVRLADAPDRLIVNREGRATKILNSRGMIGKKQLRRRPLYMTNLVWRQRMAAMTPTSVVVGGNLPALRAQAKRLGLMTVGMDGPGLVELIKNHIKKAQTSEVNKFLASRVAASGDGQEEFGTSQPLRRSLEARAKLRAAAIKNKWLVHARVQRGAGVDDAGGDSPELTAADVDIMSLPAIEEHRRLHKQRLSELPATVRAPIREDDAVKPAFLGRQTTNDGDDVLELRAGYSAWKQHLYYKGQEAFDDEVHRTDDVFVHEAAAPAISAEELRLMDAAQQGMDHAMIEEQKSLSLAAGAVAPTELQDWEAREYYLRKDVKRIEVKVKPLEQDPSKRLKESKVGQELQRKGKYLY